MKLPRDVGPIHFIGIGGIGMSGIAEVLLNLGYKDAQARNALAKITIAPETPLEEILKNALKSLMR